MSNVEKQVADLQIKCTAITAAPEIPLNGELCVDLKNVDVRDLLECLHVELSPAELVNTFGLDYFLNHIGADEVAAWLNENSHKLND